MKYIFGVIGIILGILISILAFIAVNDRIEYPEIEGAIIVSMIYLTVSLEFYLISIPIFFKKTNKKLEYFIFVNGVLFTLFVFYIYLDTIFQNLNNIYEIITPIFILTLISLLTIESFKRLKSFSKL